MRTVLALSALTGVYLLDLASVAPADIACGVVVAAGALAVAGPGPRHTRPHRHRAQ